MSFQNEVYVVDASRTPFLKARGLPGPFSASDMAVQAGRALLSRQPLSPTDIDEVVIGCMMPSEDEANIGRIIGLRLGCGDNVPGWTVQRNCASGMQALDSAIKDIAIGRHQLVLAGGTEAMSRAPLIYNRRAVKWFAGMMKARTPMAKLGQLARLNPAAFLTPIIALLKGLTDPLINMGMGQTAEEIAHEFDITRDEMDAFSVESHHRVASAQKASQFTHLTPLYDNSGKVYDKDDGVREDSTVAALAKLKPFFDKKYGRVTAANSSQVTDGAALLLLASKEAVDQYGLKPIGKIKDAEWAALDPRVMGLGPVNAAMPIMARNSLSMDHIDAWEINEAFAAQVIGCVRALDKKGAGLIDRNILNVNGGAVALGHPVGASGARIVMQLLEVLEQTNKKTGMAAICIGGGQGGAMLVERIEE